MLIPGRRKSSVSIPQTSGTVVGAFAGRILFVTLSSAPPLLELRNERSSELRIKSVLRRGGSRRRRLVRVNRNSVTLILYLQSGVGWGGWGHLPFWQVMPPFVHRGRSVDPRSFQQEGNQSNLVGTSSSYLLAWCGKQSSLCESVLYETCSCSRSSMRIGAPPAIICPP